MEQEMVEKIKKEATREATRTILKVMEAPEEDISLAEALLDKGMSLEDAMDVVCKRRLETMMKAFSSVGGNGPVSPLVNMLRNSGMRVIEIKRREE